MKSLDRISQHSFLPALVRQGSVVLDLGGNRGEFSSGIRSRYGWKVVAVEPTPDLAAHLVANGFDVVEAAVTGQGGKTRFTYDSSHELTGSVLGADVIGKFIDDVKTIEVETVALKDLLAGRTVDLVKVDIEGAELDVLLAATDDALLSVGQFTVEFHDFWYPELAGRTEEVKQRLQDLGFWMMRGTPNNKDVLFVHPDHKPGFFARLYIGLWLRNLHGLGRAAMVVRRRFGGHAR
jgi:FkbM family methyltransferase